MNLKNLHIPFGYILLHFLDLFDTEIIYFIKVLCKENINMHQNQILPL